MGGIPKLCLVLLDFCLVFFSDANSVVIFFDCDFVALPCIALEDFCPCFSSVFDLEFDFLVDDEGGTVLTDCFLVVLSSSSLSRTGVGDLGFVMLDSPVTTSALDLLLLDLPPVPMPAAVAVAACVDAERRDVRLRRPLLEGSMSQ